ENVAVQRSRSKAESSTEQARVTTPCGNERARKKRFDAKRRGCCCFERGGGGGGKREPPPARSPDAIMSRPDTCHPVSRGRRWWPRHTSVSSPTTKERTRTSTRPWPGCRAICLAYA